MAQREPLRERPIIFSAPMIRAILGGRKTQTRRLVRAPPWISRRGLHPRMDEWMGQRYTRGSGQYPGGNPTFTGDQPPGLLFTCLDGTCQRLPCPYGVPGERLWVRETFIIGYDAGNGHWSILPPTGSTERDGRAFYRATFDEPDPNTHGTMVWRPSIYMPRWVSRIDLEVTGVRVARLQDISEDDFLAEGVQPGPGRGATYVKHDAPEFPAAARKMFASLWDSINGARAPWSRNPWVWVVEFTRVRP